VALVGSRSPTPGGRALAARFAGCFVEAGLAVTSGLAAGIDAAAHQATLEAGGCTMAVIGTGPDRAYPDSHARLQARIAAEGAVLSEYLPGTAARPGTSLRATGWWPGWRWPPWWSRPRSARAR
jgi:DNA processing protein